MLKNTEVLVLHILTHFTTQMIMIDLMTMEFDY